MLDETNTQEKFSDDTFGCFRNTLGRDYADKQKDSFSRLDWKNVSPKPEKKPHFFPEIKPFFLFILPVLVINLILVLYVYQAVQIQSLKYQIRKTRQGIRLSLIKNDELKLKIAQELSITRIEKIAVDELGMKPLDRQDKNNRIFYLELPEFDK